MKCVLVTGGSRGIGSAICKKLAVESDYHILINYHSNQTAAEETLQEIQKLGATGEILGFDVADFQNVQDVLTKWQEANPEKLVEAIVNNAGITKDGLFMWMTPEDWNGVMNTSVNGFFNVTQFFIQKMLPKCTELEKAQIAKEFVKFNERCFLGLLGDMRSYNYVVIPIHDFDHVVYRIRPIDFDQQSYEGNLKIYFPQFFKENFQMVKLVMDKLKPNSVEQYRKEVRSATVKRILGSETRLDELLVIMRKEDIAPKENVETLKYALQKYTHDIHFKQCDTMGDIVSAGIDLLLKNYKNYF